MHVFLTSRCAAIYALHELLHLLHLGPGVLLVGEVDVHCAYFVLPAAGFLLYQNKLSVSSHQTNYPLRHVDPLAIDLSGPLCDSWVGLSIPQFQRCLQS